MQMTFTKQCREKWRNEINSENEKGNSLESPVTQSKTTVSQYNAPSMTLKERIEERRVVLDNEGYTNCKDGKEKNILNDVASKSDFVRKMSKTFGYEMPSNAENKAGHD